MRRIFKIKFLKNGKNNNFIAKALELPSCIAEGDTKGDAKKKLKSAIVSYLDYFVRKSKPVHLYELGKNGTDSVELDVDSSLRFRDPKTIPLSELHGEGKRKERQSLQRKEGFVKELPHNIDSRKMIAALERAGFTDIGGGDHTNMVCKLEGKEYFTSVPRHGSISDYVMAHILKQAGLTIPEFHALLEKDDKTFEMLRNFGKLKQLKRDE